MSSSVRTLPAALLAPLFVVAFSVALAAATLPPPAGAQPLVRRLAGPDRVATAAVIATDGWPTGSTTAVLADGHHDLPALVGAHLAGRLDVPLLLGGSPTPETTRQAMTSLGVSDVLAIGDVDVPDEVDHTRIDAADAVALAAEAARRPEAGDHRVVVVGLGGIADALSAANLAPARLLVTDARELSGPTRDAIAELGPAEVVVLGGEAVVSAEVADQIAALGPAVRRIAGPDRIETALAAASRAGGPVVLAAAGPFADALALVPWSARRQAALLLTPHDELPVTVEARLRHVDHAEVLIAGGTAAVGNFVDRQAAAALSGAAPPGFVGGQRPLTVQEREAMTGLTWHDGCPVPLEELVALEAAHWRFDGNVADDGLLVVNSSIAEDLTSVLARLFEARFPFGQLSPARVFDGDDDALMAANITSAFNCRTVGGTDTWSQHAYGLAVDVNPLQNPYVRDGVVQPPEGVAYLDRTDVRPGMAVEGGPVVAAFDAIGWGWGGRWRSASDYQHFSLTGR